MRRIITTALVLATGTARCAIASEAVHTDLFWAADLVPADVSVYVQVENAAAIRQTLTERPLGLWIERRLVGAELRTACGRLARAAGVPLEQLFDAELGRSLTLVVRDAAVQPAAPHARQWVIVSRLAKGVDPDDLLGHIPAKLPGSLAGFALRELHEHDLVLASAPGVLVIGPLHEQQLFRDVVRGLSEPPPVNLGDDEALVEARRLHVADGDAAIGVFVRHAPPMGGWSAATGVFDGDHLVVHHTARFDAPPFSSPLTKTEIDLAPLDTLRERAILAIMEPTDTGDGPLSTFLELRFPLLTPELRGNLGSRRLTILTTEEGRLQQPPIDVLQPCVARCVEFRDPALARAQFDRAMARLDGHLRQAESAQSASALEPRPPRIWTDDEPRHLRLPANPSGPAGQAAALFDGMSLNWCCVNARENHWGIVCTHPDAMTDICRALEAEPPGGVSRKGRWASGGTLQGRLLAQQLRSVSDKAPLFVAPDRVDQVRLMLQPIAELADGVADAGWCMERPTLNTMRLQVTLTLSPPETTPSSPPRRK